MMAYQVYGEGLNFKIKLNGKDVDLFKSNEQNSASGTQSSNINKGSSIPPVSKAKIDLVGINLMDNKDTVLSKLKKMNPSQPQIPSEVRLFLAASLPNAEIMTNYMNDLPYYTERHNGNMVILKNGDFIQTIQSTNHHAKACLSKGICDSSEEFKIDFTAPPDDERAYKIYRNVHYYNNGPLFEKVFQSIVNKYGKPSEAVYLRDGGGRFEWTWDTNGTQFKKDRGEKCALGQYPQSSGQVQELAEDISKSRCALGLQIIITVTHNLVTSISFDAVDGHALYLNSKKTNEYAKAFIKNFEANKRKQAETRAVPNI
jgi:hypothetical protein